MCVNVKSLHRTIVLGAITAPLQRRYDTDGCWNVSNAEMHELTDRHRVLNTGQLL